MTKRKNSFSSLQVDKDSNQNTTPINIKSPQIPEILGIKTPSLLTYIQNYELNMIFSPHYDEPTHEEPTNVREKVYNFVKIPWEVEKVSIFISF